jgi:hypothetical protein
VGKTRTDICQAAREVGAAGREIEGKRGSPILYDEIGRADPGLGNKGVEIARVILEPIGDGRPARLTEADQVGGDAMRNVGDDGIMLRQI